MTCADRIVLLGACLLACSTPLRAAPSLPLGTLGLHTPAGATEGSLAVELECADGIRCTLRTTTSSPGSEPLQDQRSLDHVVRLDSVPRDVVGAVRYAVDNLDKPVLLRDLVGLRALARPMLSAAPTVTGCWDLNDPTPAYTLLCTVTTRHPAAVQFVMFWSLVMDCRDGHGFCVYTFAPLTASSRK